jgi:hypothetical protein
VYPITAEENITPDLLIIIEYHHNLASLLIFPYPSNPHPIPNLNPIRAFYRIPHASDEITPSNPQGIKTFP